MRQLTFIAPGRLEWAEVPEPLLEGPDQALVRPIAVATCDLDGPMIRGEIQVRGPFGFGHEFVAEAVTVGESVTRIRSGDRVVVPFQISCGTCAPCRRSHTASCSTVRPLRAAYGLGGMVGKDWGGAMSDLVRIPFAESMLVPLPPGLDPIAIASCGDNISDAWRAAGSTLSELPGASVLVVGGGVPSIGLYAVAIARALGAHVEYVDTDPGRLALAHDLGADTIEGPFAERYGRHLITVDASGTAQGLRCAIRSTADSGICTSVAIYWQDVAMPLLEMYTRNVRFRSGRVHARAAIPHVLELVARSSFDPSLVTESVVAWEDAVEALRQRFTKLVMVPTSAGVPG